jgi:phenylacetaldehyde dehydrogenase
VEAFAVGSVPLGPGYWFPPTVIAPAEPGWRLAREEIFGPIVAVIPFEDEADAVRLANDTPYGLSGSIWTRDGARGLRLARAISSGNLSVNSHSSVRVQTSFGGMKQSGFGRELGLEALASYTDVKNVFVSTDG